MKERDQRKRTNEEKARKEKPVILPNKIKQNKNQSNFLGVCDLIALFIGNFDCSLEI